MRNESGNLESADVAPSGVTPTEGPQSVNPLALSPREIEKPAATSQQLVQQIDRLLEDLGNLAESQRDAKAFYQELLARAVMAVDASAGAIWIMGPDNNPIATVSHQLKPLVERGQGEKTFQAHRKTIKSSIEERQPRKFRTSWKGQSLSAFIWPIANQDGPFGAIAIYFDAEVPENTESVYLSFTEAIAEIASDYQSDQQRDQQQVNNQTWQRYKSFSDAVHNDLNVQSTAISIVNYGRTFYDCDRVTLAKRVGGRYRIIAASGAERVNRKARSVQLLESLFSFSFYRNDQPIVHPNSDRRLPAKLSRLLDRYLEESGGKQLLIFPIRDSKGRIQFAQSVETMRDDVDSTTLLGRVTAVESQIGSALSHASNFQSLPFLKLMIGLRACLSLSGLRKAILPLIIFCVVGLAIGSLFFFKTELTVAARGTLTPENDRMIFASYDGTIQRTHAAHGDSVTAEQLLIELESNELNLQISSITGKIETARSKLDTLEIAKSNLQTGDVETQATLARFAGDTLEINEQIKQFRQELDVLTREKAKLKLTSPIAGTIVTWDVARKLEGRPVKRGDVLMRVVENEGEWVAEIRVPDDQIADIINARDEQGPELQIDLVIATHPSQSFSGEIVAVSTVAQESTSAVNESQVLVTVKLSENAASYFRPGATVMAKFRCGQVTLAHAWFHQIVKQVKHRFF